VKRAVLFVALFGASCGAPLMKLPSGPGAPATDAAEVLQQATAACRGIRTLSAEVAASGKVGGQRFRATLLVGVSAPDSARVEAVAPFGAPAFILAAQHDDTTLLLPRDERVLQHGKSDDVLDAVAGVRLSAAELRGVLAGCDASDAAGPNARALGADWRVFGESLYVHRSGATQPWQLVAVNREFGRVEYRDFANGLPRSIHILSRGGDDVSYGNLFDLTLGLSQVETNVTLGPEVFRVDIPRGAQPITLDELRHARPGVREN
jgi:outer membrane lipoprotein-sorting protein